MKTLTQLKIQFSHLLFCISCLLFSCTTKQDEKKTEQDSTHHTNKPDSVYQYNQAVINRYDTIRNYVPIDKDTLVSEREILLDNKPYNLKITRYCLNDSAISYALASNNFRVSHNYSVRIKLEKDQEVILNQLILKEDFKENLNKWTYSDGILYDIQFESSKDNQLYFKASFIHVDTIYVEELGLRVFYQTEKKGQLLTKKNWATYSDLRLFELWNRNSRTSSEVTGFVPLSGSYSLSNKPDSLAIPNLYGNIDNGYSFDPDATYDDEYIKLDSKYRKRFLTKTGISETDKLFIYDYYNNTLDSFTVKSLSVVAIVDVYTDIEDRPHHQEDYFIGFEIKKKSFYSGLVHIGLQNPFIQGQLKPIVWKEISPADFPLKPISSGNTLLLKRKQLSKRRAFKYETKDLGYYVQEFDFARRVLVVDLPTNMTVLDNFIFYSADLLPNTLNNKERTNQWTGILFKHKPPVIFGFETSPYYNPGIIVLDKPDNGAGVIGIHSDSRY
jgi:Domain of unknown function (DUF4738)